MQFEQAAAELRAVLATGALVEHIGSTAVPGLCAKPVLDVLVGLERLEEAEHRIGALAALGYVYRPAYEAQLPGRRYFVRAEGSTPRVHLHCVVRDGRLWLQHMAFRAALRQCRHTRDAYAALKRSLARMHADDKQAYTEAKAPFILQVLAQAAERAGTGRPASSTCPAPGPSAPTAGGPGTGHAAASALRPRPGST